MYIMMKQILAIHYREMNSKVNSLYLFMSTFYHQYSIIYKYMYISFVQIDLLIVTRDTWECREPSSE